MNTIATPSRPVQRLPLDPRSPRLPRLLHLPVLSPVLPVLLALLAAPPAWAQPAVPAADQRIYTPGRFDAIEIGGSAVVRFVQGQSEQITIDGDEDVQRSVRVELSGSTVSIRHSGAWKFWTPQRLQVSISARDLRRLSISGAADFVAPAPVQLRDLAVSISGSGLARFDQLKADSLRFAVSGAGDGRFAGTAQDVSLVISGRGDFRGDELQVRTAKVSISGLGNARLWVQDALSVGVSGIGKVEYWGAPEVTRRSSGMATINGLGARPPVPGAPPAPPAPPAAPAHAAEPVKP